MVTTPLVWTREAPKEPGWYWNRGGPDDKHPAVVEVFVGETNGIGALCVDGSYGTSELPLEYFPRTEWSGPLPPPQEAT